MVIVDVIDMIIDMLYMDRKKRNDFALVKRQGGLPEQNWNEVWERANTFPVEVQTAYEAKNEDHVRLYDQDLNNVLSIQAETKQLLKNEDVLTFWSDVTKTDKHSCSGSVSSIPRSMRKFLYGGENDRDILSDTEHIYSNFEILIEDANKNVGIAQKGKTGEDYVGSMLKQYGSKFHFLENIVLPAYEEEGSTSETDVYIINCKGIFVCEVKNYGTDGQTIYMPRFGDWQLLNEQGRVIANKPSAFVQNERHCNATRSFIKEHLGIEIPIFSVVIIANDRVNIQNEAPYDHVAIKPQQIGELVGYGNDVIDEEMQMQIVEAFEEYKLDANDFPVKINADKARYLQSMVKNYIPYLKANKEMACAYEKREKAGRTVAWIITSILAILSMIPLVEEGEGLVIFLGVAAWGTTFLINNFFSAVFSIASIILLPVWIITLKPPIGALGIACMVLSFWISDKVGL